MRKNIVSLGDKTISGEVGKIFAAGDVNIADANVLQLNGAGDIIISKSYIADTKIAGDIKANNSNFGTVRIAGEIIFKDLCKVDTLIALGTLEADNLECNTLRNFSEKTVQIRDSWNRTKNNLRFDKHWNMNFNADSEESDSDWDINLNWGLGNKGTHSKGNALNPKGGSVFKGSIKAETFENLCDFSVDFDYHFKNIISMNPLHREGVLECDRLYSFDLLDMEGVSADYIYIHPYAESKLQQVMGSDIVITEVFPADDIFTTIPKSVNIGLYKRVAEGPAGILELESIEGDNICIDHVKAKIVSGDNITIGDYCIIDRVEYKGNIQVSTNASVKELCLI
jgi:hypothetical protein